jgi:signal peptide peptidase SppA
MINSFDLKYWAGTEESLGVYLLCLKKMIDNGEFQASESYVHDSTQPPAKPDRVPRLFSMVGDVAVIKIAGPLNNSDDPYNKYYGVTGYPEIREALVYAAKKPEVGAIVLDVASGGGAVAGVFDTANLIATIDKKVKPVHTFSGAQIASAAYLLGVAARTVNIDQMTEAGSIGVVMVHKEMSKMLKDIGITPTVIRSGKYKALGNPYEPLSEIAIAEFEGQIKQLEGIFEQHTADHLGTTKEVVHEKMGQGRVFIGTRAKEVGLVDSITSFDALVSKLQGGIDSAKERSKYGANSTNQNNKGILVSKQALTEQDIAVLALGGAGAQATADEGVGIVASPAEGSDTVAGGDQPDTKATAEPAKPEAAKPEAGKPAEPTALQLVQSQLAEAQGRVTDLTIELRDVKAANESMKGMHASMRAIVVASVTNLKIALGQTPGGAEALADEALLAEHAALTKVFNDKFKAGGVAAVAPADSTEKKGDANEHARRQARIAATRPTK